MGEGLGEGVGTAEEGEGELWLLLLSGLRMAG